jgi:hypothetical protein
MSQHWNQNRSSFRTGEGPTHVQARLKTAQVLMSYDFNCDFGENAEGYRIPEILPPLDREKEYKIDIFAVKNYKPNRPAGLAFPLIKLVELDGTIHRSSKINIAKTKVKHGQILDCLNLTIYHLDPADVLSQDWEWIAKKLGLDLVQVANRKIP